MILQRAKQAFIYHFQVEGHAQLAHSAVDPRAME